MSNGNVLECRNMVKMVHHLLRKLWYSLFLHCFAFCRSESWKDACSWVADTWGNSSWANGKRMPGLSPSQTHPLLARLLVKSKKHILKCSKIQPHVTSFIQCTYEKKIIIKVEEMPWFVNYNDTFPCFNFKYWGFWLPVELNYNIHLRWKFDVGKNLLLTDQKVVL